VFVEVAINLVAMVLAVTLVVAAMAIGEATVERYRFRSRRGQLARLEAVTRAEERRIQSIIDRAQAEMFQTILRDMANRRSSWSR
jgi:hypothetical protein